MKTTVFIPAKNEEARIARCLERLDARTCVPVVLVNDTTDKTVEIARHFGAAVIETEVPGKLPALQNALRLMHHEVQRTGVAVIDADTVPLFPRTWLGALTQAVGTSPTMVVGPIIWQPSDVKCFPDRALRTVHGEIVSRRPESVLVNEANMFFLPNDIILEEILALRHVYPGEGIAIRDRFTGFGGAYERAGLGASVLTSDRFLPKKFRQRKDWRERYRERAPEGSIAPWNP
jgi:glycosyltransferase involved in cell wall biosynthesis